MENDMCHFHKLPNDVLLEIFSLFSTRELSRSVLPVCRRWQTVGSYEFFWKEIDFGTYNMAKLEQYAAMVKAHPCIKTIICVQASKEFLEKVVAFCPDLRTLVIPHTVCISSLTIRRLIAGCPLLESLDLSFNKQSYAFRSSLSYIVHFKNLKSVKLVNCDWVSSSFACTLVSMCPNLECLHLDCVFLPQDAVHEILTKLQPNVRELSLKCERLDTTMKEIFHDCHKLEKLKVKALLGPIDMQASHTCHHQVQFKELSFTTCAERLWGNEHMQRMFLGSVLPNVTQLFIEQASGNDTLAEEITRAFPKLEHLTLVLCNGLTHAGVKKVLRNCPHLRELHLHFCKHITKECFNRSLPAGRKDLYVEMLSSAVPIVGHMHPQYGPDVITEKFIMKQA